MKKSNSNKKSFSDISCAQQSRPGEAKRTRVIQTYEIWKRQRQRSFGLTFLKTSVLKVRRSRAICVFGFLMWVFLWEMRIRMRIRTDLASLGPRFARRRRNTYVRTYARLGSARLGSARLGSARLGSARLGSARLRSARLGPGRHAALLLVPQH